MVARPKSISGASMAGNMNSKFEPALCLKHGPYIGDLCPTCGLLDEAAEKPDMVNQPPHYKRGGMEAIDVIDAFGGLDPEHYKSTALAYILRAGRKGEEAQDLEKAVWYLQRRINNLRKKSQGAV